MLQKSQLYCRYVLSSNLQKSLLRYEAEASTLKDWWCTLKPLSEWALVEMAKGQIVSLANSPIIQLCDGNCFSEKTSVEFTSKIVTNGNDIYFAWELWRKATRQFPFKGVREGGTEEGERGGLIYHNLMCMGIHGVQNTVLQNLLELELQASVSCPM